MYYVRATGNNRYAGGTTKWLKIRNIRKTGDIYYEIEVRIRGLKRVVGVVKDNSFKNLEFAKGWPGLMPVSCHTVLEEFENGNAK
jgi:hypothetical protein